MTTQRKPSTRPLKLVRSPGTRGAKTKATPTVLDKLCTALRTGATHKLAAQYAGISEASFYKYMQDLPDFAEAIGTAEASGAMDNLTLVKHLASSQDESVALKAATWLLERRYPEMYGRNVVVNEHHGEQQIRVIMDAAWRGEVQTVEATIPQIAASATETETINPNAPSVNLTFEGDGE